MNHDILCPIEDNPLARECRTCDLIAKVRADERRKEEARRMAKFGYWHDYRPELP